MSTVIDILNDDGSLSLYRKLSARLPAFIARYGPDQGYAVVIEATDSLSLQPGLLRLYEQAIACGHNLESLGLPPLTKDRTMVFRARLEDSHGRILATASAVKPVIQYKDFEVGETAARQRLLAALGFGGEVLDADEAADQTDQRLVTAAHEQVTDDAESAPAPPEAASNEPMVESDATEAVPASIPTPTAEADPTAPAGDVVPPALVRQIAHLAKMKNRDLPAYGNLQEARDALKQLMGA